MGTSSRRIQKVVIENLTPNVHKNYAAVNLYTLEVLASHGRSEAPKNSIGTQAIWVHRLIFWPFISSNPCGQNHRVS